MAKPGFVIYTSGVGQISPNTVGCYHAMSATDIAKEIVRIATTATLSKDVIDLLEKKLSLLTEEIESLRSKVSHLEVENATLKAQLQHLRPADELPKETADVLQFFFDQGRDLSIEQVAQQFHFQTSVAEYHLGVLEKRRFVRQTRAVSVQSSGAFGLTQDGRGYVMQTLR